MLQGRYVTQGADNGDIWKLSKIRSDGQSLATEGRRPCAFPNPMPFLHKPASLPYYT